MAKCLDRIAVGLSIDTPPSAKKKSIFKLKGIDLAKLYSKQKIVYFILYSKCSPPLSVVNDDYFRDMFISSPPDERANLDKRELHLWIDLEFKIFSFFAQLEARLCYIYHFGNKYMQLLHDGGTANNHRKYQALGAQYIQP